MSRPSGNGSHRFMPVNLWKNNRALQKSNDEWEKHKSEILLAYSTTNTIGDVITYMSENHEFHAT